MTLGSLFDGSGGFPLAGALSGIEPVWASEIEAYPISVTKARFPHMQHLGDITQIHGDTIQPVDIITFGSPCQDLSVAGKQAGILEGSRSSLFFEAVRIINEMRDATNGWYPRFAVWENVPGALISHKGEDFYEVLCALCDVRLPRHKGRWRRAGVVVGSSGSLAWRVYDAQFWGVPQRRARIYLVRDFRGDRAGEILFKPESMCWHSPQSESTWEGASRFIERSAGGESA